MPHQPFNPRTIKPRVKAKSYAESAQSYCVCGKKLIIKPANRKRLISEGGSALCFSCYQRAEKLING